MSTPPDAIGEPTMPQPPGRTAGMFGPLARRPGSGLGRLGKFALIVVVVGLMMYSMFATNGGKPQNNAASTEPAFKPAPKIAALPQAPASTEIIYRPAPAPADNSAAEAERRRREEAERAEREQRLKEARTRMRSPLMVDGGNGPSTLATLSGLTDDVSVASAAPAAPVAQAVRSLLPPLPEGVPGGSTQQAARMAAAGAAANGAAAGPSTPRYLDQVGARGTRKVAILPPDGNQDYTIMEGKLISGVLETAINSDMPGYVRAVVDEDVYGERGRKVLFPRMTRLIGEYDNSVRNGQSRVLVVWRRAIMPNGSTVDLGSYGTDGLGRGGLAADGVDRHFMERFGGAILISVIGAAATNASAGNGYGTYQGDIYRAQAAAAAANMANSVIQQNMNIAPTITVHQGSRIKVFVSKDIDFSAAAAGITGANAGEVPVPARRP